MADGLTIRTALDAAASLLRAGGNETARLDARVLLGAALGIDAGAVLLKAGDELPGPVYGRFEAMICQRLAGTPVARILGKREFWGLDFSLAASSLIPRPDSETLVEAACAMLRAGGERSACVLDLGTGPGTLLLAILSTAGLATGIGVDRDEATLAAARSNAERFGLSGRAQFICADWGAALKGQSFDLIVSNPPYIRSSDIAGLAVEVRDHDPLLALDGGADGLDAYRSLLPMAARLAKGGGQIMLEIGEDQEQAVITLVEAHGFRAGQQALRDLAGHPRVVIGYKVA